MQRLAVWVQVHARGGARQTLSVCKVDVIEPDPYGALATMFTKGMSRKNPSSQVRARAHIPCPACRVGRAAREGRGAGMGRVAFENQRERGRWGKDRC
jgi:hypothetical protein